MANTERAFVWAIALGLAVQFGVPVLENIIQFGSQDVVIGILLVLSFVTTVGYGYAGGGIPGAVLLGISPLVGGLGVVTVDIRLGLGLGDLLTTLVAAVVAGVVVGSLGMLVGRGVEWATSTDS